MHRVVLTDFGSCESFDKLETLAMAKVEIPLFIDSIPERSVSSQILPCGTPNHFSPEVADHRYTPRMDVWAAGLTIYHLCVLFPFSVLVNALVCISC